MPRGHSSEWDTFIQKSSRGMESEPMLTPRENPSTGALEEGGVRDIGSGKTASPTRYRLSYSDPRHVHCFDVNDQFGICVCDHCVIKGPDTRRVDIHENFRIVSLETGLIQKQTVLLCTNHDV